MTPQTIRSPKPTQQAPTRQASPRDLQDAFLKRCITSPASLHQVMGELGILPEMLSRWLTTRAFRQRLNAARHALRRARELQLEVGAWKAAQALCRSDDPQAGGLDIKVCVELIKLARDSRARKHTEHPSARSVAKSIGHPDLDVREARRLARELDRPRNQQS